MRVVQDAIQMREKGVAFSQIIFGRIFVLAIRCGRAV